MENLLVQLDVIEQLKQKGFVITDKKGTLVTLSRKIGKSREIFVEVDDAGNCNGDTLAGFLDSIE